MSANQTVITASDNKNAKNHALVAYGLMGIGMFTAIPMFVGAIWAMVKRSDALGTLYYSHYTNAIRTFWWSLGWGILGAILSYVLIGYAILLITWVWVFYRLANGFAKITSDKAYSF